MADGETAIVSEAERARLLAILDSRLRQYGRGLRPVRQPRSLLGGLIRCAACGRSAVTFGDSYRCRRRFVDAPDCSAPLVVSVAAVEAAVRRAWALGLAALEPDSPILGAVSNHWLQNFDPEPLRERVEIEAAIADAQERIYSADTDRYERGTLDADRHSRVVERIRSSLAGLTARLAALPTPEADLGALLDPELSLPAIEAADVMEARTLLRLAIDRVVVCAAPRRGARFDPRERMRIVWHAEDD